MRIGIPMSPSKTQYFVNKAYIDYILEADFEPISIVPGNDIELMVSMLDGLILPGGIDVDPIHYGEDNYSSFSSDPEKDEFERAVFHACRKAKLPIFGICRGFQLIIREYLLDYPNHASVPEFLQHIAHHNQVDGQNLARNSYQHFVEFWPSRLYGTGVKGTSDMAVNSMHHQCLTGTISARVGGLKIAAWTDRGIKDHVKSKKVVWEAFTISGWGAPITAVQWHPEELMDTDLIRNFFLNSNKSLKRKSV